ncbi:hypothetical protein SDC9_160121 [bioreactor metagenome]|uniref:Uncharacterized protein n=1 Tax=bioreactor metagenome TaxID=1076179 RepID=A0A645FEJ3_9ZZZZ
MEKLAVGSSIHRPGRVKARPPATMAPLLMMVWVTLISCNVEPFALRRAAMLTTVTKMVGHGRAPIRKATYMELAVMTNRPAMPIMAPRTVRCLFIFYTSSVSVW